MAVSAVTGDGIDGLLVATSDRLRAVSAVTELLIPYDRGDAVAAVHREGELLSTSHEAGGIRIRARLSGPSVGRLAEFVVERPAAAPR